MRETELNAREIREGLNSLMLAEIVTQVFVFGMHMTIYYSQEAEDASEILSEMKRYGSF